MEAIGRLQVEQLLGSGSFASVWLAYDPDLDSRVAVKVLAENWALQPDMRARFIEEARILRRLEHPRIARVYAIDTLDDGRPYLVMEHADRGSLFDVIRARHATGQGFSLDEAMSISLELAECVSVAHDLGVIHRDLKPSNVLYRTVPAHHQAALRRRGLPAPAEQMLLVDFGLARKFQALSESTVAAGTPHYMAPEQAKGKADARVDVYASAVILYQLLAGEVPFPHSSIGEVIHLQMTTGPPSITALRPDVGPRLATVISRALATDPAERPRSIAEWIDDLNAVQSSIRPIPQRSHDPAPVTEAVTPRPPTPEAEPLDAEPESSKPSPVERTSSQPPTEVSQDPAIRQRVTHSPATPEKPPSAPLTICKDCGEANPADFSFCGACGSTVSEEPLTRPCPACDEPNPIDFSFCGECGTPIRGGGDPT